MKKQILLFFLLFLLIILSGCLEFIDTKQKQACISVTHASNNSISNCYYESSCYNDIKKNSYISTKLPLDIYNLNTKYLNNIASTTYFYNKSTKYIEKINKACDNLNIKEVIDNVNDLFFYFSNIFTYFDQSSKTSIVLLKEYAYFLKEQDINLITSEKLFDSYIKINNNLNQLQKKDIKDSYIYQLKDKQENIQDIAINEFGFKTNYISKTNFIDLTSYYYSEIITPKSEIKIPIFNKSINYMINKISGIYNIQKINQNLKKADSYNFYILLDEFIGNKDSLFIEFIKINNEINENLDLIYEKITNKEQQIQENKEYLRDKDIYLYLKYKNQFENKQITFGKYLDFLYNLENKISENQYNKQTRKDIENNELDSCLLDIKENTKNITIINNLLKELNNQNNVLEKIKICNEIKKYQNLENCLYLLDLAIDLELTTKKEYDNCEMIVLDIENYLEKDIKIITLKQNLEQNQKLINKLETKDLEIIDIEYDILDLFEKTNIELYKNLDKYLKQQKQYQEKIIQKIKEKLKKDYKIIFKENYYLELYNPYGIIINDLEIDLENIKGLDNYTITKYNKLILKKVYPKINYYKIDYQITQKIEENILHCLLDKCYYKLKIYNDIENINTQIFIEDLDELISGGYLDINNQINYKTKKINEVIFTKKIFEYNKNIDILEINNKFIEKQTINIQNISNNLFNNQLYLLKYDTKNIVEIKINNKEINYKINPNNYLVIDFRLDKKEIKEIKINLIKEKQEIISEIENIIIEITRLKNSEFIEIQDKVKEYNYDIKEEYKISEIKEIISKKPEINKILNLENQLLSKKLEYRKYFEEIKDPKKQEIDEIKDINTKLEKIKILKTEIQENQENLKNQEKQNQLNEINYLKEKIYEYDLKEQDIDLNNLENIKENINLEITQKAKEYYEFLENFEIDIDYKKALEKIELLEFIYSDYSLKELYAINYYPKVNNIDSQRLKKQIDFLDTIKYQTQKEEFTQYYKNKQYEKAIQAIETMTIERLKQIKTEYELIDSGIEEIKKDSSNLLADYKIKYKNTNHKLIKEEIKKAEDNFENQKYLNTISILKSIDSKNTQKIPFIITFSLILVFLLLFIYFKKPKTKKISKTQKKLKIIRDN